MFRQGYFSNGKFNWYEILWHLRKGGHVAIKPTLKCNLGCSYCGAEMPGSACWVDPGRELTARQWLDELDLHNTLHPIKQVGITGGECALYKELPELMKGILDRGWLIYIYTNLGIIEPFMKFAPDKRIKFMATLHEGADRERFKRNLAVMSKNFFMLNQELEQTWIYGNDLASRKRKLKFAENLNQLGVDLFGPDGRFYPRDEQSNKDKYDAWRKECKGMVANPYREKLIQIGGKRLG